MPSLVGGITACLAAALLWRLVLPRLAEPADLEQAAGKVAYRDLATPTVTAVVAVLAGAAAASGLALTPPPWWPLWWVLAAAALPLACIDALTTWIPARPSWVVLAVLILSSAVAGPGLGWDEVARTMLGGLAAGALYWTVWRLTGAGFGFGDVRFAPMVGLVAASTGWTAWFLAMLTGPLITLVVVVIRRRLGHQMHPWAPGLLVGPHIALWALALT